MSGCPHLRPTLVALGLLGLLLSPVADRSRCCLLRSAGGKQACCCAAARVASCCANADARRSQAPSCRCTPKQTVGLLTIRTRAAERHDVWQAVIVPATGELLVQNVASVRSHQDLPLEPWRPLRLVYCRWLI